MPRVCQITGKKTATGNNRNWSMRASKRKFGINMQTKKMVVNGKVVKVKATAKGLKTLKKREQKKALNKAA